MNVYDECNLCLQAAGDAAEQPPPPATSVVTLGRPDDGYRVAKRLGAAAVQLREQLLQLLKGARFWEKDSDWLQVCSISLRITVNTPLMPIPLQPRPRHPTSFYPVLNSLLIFATPVIAL